MVTKILTNLSVAKKRGKKEGIIYRSPRIYLPTKLTDDSSFPFLEGDEVSVRVDGRRLVVERLKKRVGGAGGAVGRRAVNRGSRAGKKRRGQRSGRKGLKRVGVRTRP